MAGHAAAPGTPWLRDAVRSLRGGRGEQRGERFSKSAVAADVPPHDNLAALSRGLFGDCMSARHGRGVHHDQQPGFWRQSQDKGPQGTAAG